MKKSISALTAPFAIVAFLAVGFLMLLYYLTVDPAPSPLIRSSQSLPMFASCSALQDALKEAQKTNNRFILEEKIALPTPQASTSADSAAPGYSATNVQVTGVDEADIVKTDGKYIYTISHGKLSIIKAYPADQATLASQTVLSITPQELFIGDKTAVVFGTSTPQILKEQGDTAAILRSNLSRSFTAIQIFDISDTTRPALVRTMELEGSYLTSRKIGSQVYIVVNSYPDYTILDTNAPPDEIVPLYRVMEGSETSQAFHPVAGCADIAYFPDVVAEQFVTVASFDLAKNPSDLHKETILGSGQNVYASDQALYVAATKNSGNWWLGDVTDVTGQETTTVHVFDLKNGTVSYRGNLEAPGNVLNQFSMDENNGYFRIATTRGHVSRTFLPGQQPSSGVYVFDKNLDRTGKIDELAPGEQIYSARFVGDRVYLVTFQKVDPLFVIGLSDPREPILLGKLKIPGFSDYLHPYDENHIIGLGKEAIPSEEGNFSWYQGMKLALFDVTDVTNPQQMFTTSIGDRGTDSYALHDHKAFLFDKSKNILVIPVLLAEISSEQKQLTTAPTTYGEFTYQGAFVYNLTLDGGFVEKGRITHYVIDDAFKKSGYNYYGDGNSIQRILYIGRSLYTISENKIKINSLDTLDPQGEVQLCTGDCIEPNLKVIQ